MSRQDRDVWEEKHRRQKGDAAVPPPSPFVAEHAARLHPGRTLDLAAGSGRNALFLAALGHRVVAVDIARAALERLKRRSSGIAVAQVDLDHPAFRPSSVANVVCVDFLDRRLFPEIRTWLRPGGILLYDTFLIDQRLVGHPRNPDFLLRHGELRERLSGYRILHYREGRVSDGAGTAFRAGALAVRADD